MRVSCLERAGRKSLVSSLGWHLRASASVALDVWCCKRLFCLSVGEGRERNGQGARLCECTTHHSIHRPQTKRKRCLCITTYSGRAQQAEVYNNCCRCFLSSQVLCVQVDTAHLVVFPPEIYFEVGLFAQCSWEWGQRALCEAPVRCSRCAAIVPPWYIDVTDLGRVGVNVKVSV